MPVPPKPKPPTRTPKKSTSSKAKPSATKARRSPGYSTALTSQEAQLAQGFYGYGNSPRVLKRSSRAEVNSLAKKTVKRWAAEDASAERKARQRGMATTARQRVESSGYGDFPASTDRGARKAPKRMSYQTRKSGGRKA